MAWAQQPGTAGQPSPASRGTAPKSASGAVNPVAPKAASAPAPASSFKRATPAKAGATPAQTTAQPASASPVTGNAAMERTPLEVEQQALPLQQQGWQTQQQTLAIQEQSFRTQERALPPGQRAMLKPIAYHVYKHHDSVVLHPFKGDIGEALFYSVPGDRSLDSFRSHASRITVIAPQAFALDSRGDLHGSLSSDVVTVASANSVGLMPLVINADFSRKGATHLLDSAAARDRAVGQLVNTARQLHLAGWQIDFENLSATERDDFTRFVTEVARGLHHDGRQLSVAVAARTSERHTDTWQTFSGVYDYAGLADAADFLSVMAYPEHDGSHPGPLASYPWVKQVVEHVLLYVPPQKLSLGLPTYQTDWGKRRVKVSIIRRVGRRIRHIVRWVLRMESHNGPADHGDYTLHWDPVLKSSYRVYWRHHRRHIVWIEDERSFAAKLQLVAEYHLRGFSVWRIGLEDPHIWAELPRAERLAKTAPAPANGELPQLIDRTGASSSTSSDSDGNGDVSGAAGEAQADSQIDR